MEKPIQTTVYIDAEDYKKLKVKLITKGLTFTKWLEQKVKEEIATES
jgi:hypothetical protein